MFNLLIDSTPAAASGTALVPPGRKAAINMLGSIIEFEFVDGTEAGLNVEPAKNGAKIVCTSMDRPIGAAATIPDFINHESGVYNLTLGFYSIGEGSNISRIIHYTLARA